MTPRIARFEWDNANLGHIAKHLVAREEVEQAFLDPFSILDLYNNDRGERRYRMLAETSDGRVLIVIFAIRKQSIRTVTAFSAKSKLLAKYRRRETT